MDPRDYYALHNALRNTNYYKNWVVHQDLDDAVGYYIEQGATLMIKEYVEGALNFLKTTEKDTKTQKNYDDLMEVQKVLDQYEIKATWMIICSRATRCVEVAKKA